MTLSHHSRENCLKKTRIVFLLLSGSGTEWWFYMEHQQLGCLKIKRGTPGKKTFEGRICRMVLWMICFWVEAKLNLGNQMWQFVFLCSFSALGKIHHFTIWGFSWVLTICPNLPGARFSLDKESDCYEVYQPVDFLQTVRWKDITK